MNNFINPALQPVVVGPLFVIRVGGVQLIIDFWNLFGTPRAARRAALFRSPGVLVLCARKPKMDTWLEQKVNGPPAGGRPKMNT